MKIELLSCPFCGGEAVEYYKLVEEGTHAYSDDYSVQCRKCASGTAVDYETQEEANKFWNTRVSNE